MRRWRRKSKVTDDIQANWAEDVAKIEAIEADDALTADEKRAAQVAVMMRNNGGQPHGIRNVWTGPGKPPSGFGYYDVYGRRNY